MGKKEKVLLITFGILCVLGVIGVLIAIPIDERNKEVQSKRNEYEITHDIKRNHSFLRSKSLDEENIGYEYYVESRLYVKNMGGLGVNKYVITFCNVDSLHIAKCKNLEKLQPYVLAIEEFNKPCE